MDCLFQSSYNAKKYSIVTQCSARKRGAVDPHLIFFADGVSNSDGLNDWFTRLSKAGAKNSASNVYIGNSIYLARMAASLLNQDYFIISAGLGLIESTTQIPNYEATVSGNSSITERLGCSPSEWWKLLQKNSKFTSNWPDHSQTLLIAASEQYMQMIADDLMSTGRPNERVRIFTRTNLTKIPVSLRPSVMPYDARLDGEPIEVGTPNSFKGTLSDFASRALFHFVKVVLPQSPDGQLIDHQKFVTECMNKNRVIVRLNGVSRTDSEIMQIILEHGASVGWKCGATLRLFRDHLNIACEQKRFRNLFVKVLTQKSENKL